MQKLCVPRYALRDPRPNEATDDRLIKYPCHRNQPAEPAKWRRSKQPNGGGPRSERRYRRRRQRLGIESGVTSLRAVRLCADAARPRTRRAVRLPIASADALRRSSGVRCLPLPGAACHGNVPDTFKVLSQRVIAAVSEIAFSPHAMRLTAL